MTGDVTIRGKPDMKIIAFRRQVNRSANCLHVYIDRISGLGRNSGRAIPWSELVVIEYRRAATVYALRLFDTLSRGTIERVSSALPFDIAIICWYAGGPAPKRVAVCRHRAQTGKQSGSITVNCTRSRQSCS